MSMDLGHVLGDPRSAPERLGPDRLLRVDRIPDPDRRSAKNLIGSGQRGRHREWRNCSGIVHSSLWLIVTTSTIVTIFRIVRYGWGSGLLTRESAPLTVRPCHPGFTREPT